MDLLETFVLAILITLLNVSGFLISYNTCEQDINKDRLKILEKRLLILESREKYENNP